MRAKAIEIKEKFSKGLARNKWDNNIPDQYCHNIVNMRIKDKGITPRFGYISVYSGSSTDRCRWIFGDNNTKRLFRVMGEKREEVDYDNNAVIDRSGMILLPQTPYNFIQFDDYIVLLNGTTAPYIFNTATNTLAVATDIDANVFPWFWEVFGNYTFLAYKNKLYFSGPATLGNESDAVYWTSGWSPTTQQIVYKSNIVGLKSTLDRLWIFTEDYVEYLDESTAQLVWSTANIFSVRFAEWQNIFNNNCIVAVGSKLFFVTKGKKIKSIGYKQWVSELQIGNVSDPDSPEEVGIDQFMDTEISAEQPDMFGIFNDNENIVERHMRSSWSLFNDIVVIYDLPSRSFIKDTGKNFEYATLIGTRMFAAQKFLVDEVFENGIGRSDRGQSFTCKYETTKLTLWLPNLNKFFRGAEFSGKINDLTTMRISSDVDGVSVLKPLVIAEPSGWLTQNQGIAMSTVWWAPISWWSVNGGTTWLRLFRKVITQSQVRKKWLANVWKIETSWVWQDWYLDYMALFAYISDKYKKYRIKDKF